ncbi:glycosyltransferase [Pseudomonas japonica]|uniref:glycosyltransferase n=1 Tax=Pseudomonas japonica TaxID=256466 RepID=UPI0015E447E4|nr:glycosyltransferase [Pseudomonas japonica]MBA1288777.1 glycosyltransferase [Pseudomonas japonica]
MSSKKVFVVLGMHRSGTSAITRGLQVLGIALGDRLMPQASGNNEKGFWEDVDINRLNIELLNYLNDDWDCLVPLSRAQLQRPEVDAFRLRAVELIRNKIKFVDVYGMKDPRISRLLPFWQSVFTHLGISVSYIIACRNPMSVVRSLQARDGFPLEKGYQLWLEYSLASLRDTVGEARVVVDYDRLMESPASELNRIAQRLGLEFREDGEEYIKYESEFLEAGLRHSRFEFEDIRLESAASPAVVDLFEELLKLAQDEQTPDAEPTKLKIKKLDEEQQRNVPLLRYANNVKSLESQLISQAEALSNASNNELVITEKYKVLQEEAVRLKAQISSLEAGNKRQASKVSALTSETAALQGSLMGTSSETAALQASLMEQSSEAAALRVSLVAANSEVEALRASLFETRASTSWRLTGPLRSAGGYKVKLHKGITALSYQIRRESLRSIAKKTIRVIRQEGLQGLKARVYRQYLAARSNQHVVIGEHADPQCADLNQVSIQPANIVRRKDAIYELAPHSGGYTYIEPQRPSELTSVLDSLTSRPLFSIVIPIFNTPVDLLNAVLVSVRNQWYPDWELILADDASTGQATKDALAAIDDSKVKVIHLDKNSGISGATNVAMDAAAGDYIVFMDHDDELTVDCLYEMALCIDREDPDFIYSDEDKLTEAGEYAQPHFKPTWSPDTLMSTMYTCHASCVRRSIVSEIGGLRSQFDGCQDWDFVLRIAEHTDRISHIPKVLYHWRILPESVASNLAAKPYVIETSCRVREEALARRGQEGTLEPVHQVPGHFRVNYKMRGQPLISIIIPTRDNGSVLERCVESILEKSSYTKVELIILDNGSVESNTIKYLATLQETGKAYVIRHDAEFNFSELNNIGANAARGELLLFLNDDTEVLCVDWLERLAGYAQLEHVGAVGAKLIYPGGQLVQHAGVLNLEDGPGHAFLRSDSNQPGYFMRNLLEYNWLAVTGACLMMEAIKYKALSGFDESLPIAYNDIDLCMRAIKNGYFNVVCQAVTLIHHESISRGVDHIDPLKHARLKRELHHLYDLNPEFFQYDPFYNVNLHPNGINFEVPV